MPPCKGGIIKEIEQTLEVDKSTKIWSEASEE